jgi:hypothetical protein
MGYWSNSNKAGLAILIVFNFFEIIGGLTVVNVGPNESAHTIWVLMPLILAMLLSMFN